jgi:hypothetical protein
MRVKITIDIDNAAFEDSDELSRVIHETADKAIGLPLRPGTWISIFDINGNKVGKLEFIK